MNTIVKLLKVEGELNIGKSLQHDDLRLYNAVKIRTT